MENPQSKGMSKGCLIGLIVGGIIVVIIAVGLTTCWIYKEDLAKMGPEGAYMSAAITGITNFTDAFATASETFNDANASTAAKYA